MPHLGGKGPLGQKQPKPAKVPKPMRKVSDKRAAYLASPERTAGKAHMARVAMLPCLVCGAWPSEVHHLPDPRADQRTIPLCKFHHRREFGPQAYHYSRRNFNALHGSDEVLLARTMAMLQK